MQNSQYIEKDKMERVHVLLASEKARGRTGMKVRDILNEVVELGLQEYVKAHGVIMGEGNGEKSLPLMLGRRTRETRGSR